MINASPTYDFAIILPVYNPTEGWEKTVLAKIDLLRNLHKKKSIGFVLVNDGSNAVAFERIFAQLKQSLKDTVFIDYPENQGKGFALRKGVEAMNAAKYVLTDIDFPYTIESMDAVMQSLEKGQQMIAAGSRTYLYYNKVDFFRSKLSRLLRYFIRHFFKIPIDDTQCGLKAFDASVKDLFLSVKTNRYLFDLEFIVLAAKTKTLRIVPIPVQLRDGIVLRRLPAHILFQELGNFFRIIFIKLRK